MAELLIGSCLLIFVLWLSAYLQADIAWLHFSSLDVSGPRSLCRCSPADGAISSVSRPLLSRTILMFLSRPFSAAGATGCSSRSTPVSCNESIKIVVVPAWIGNFLVVVGSAWAYAQLGQKRLSDLTRFALTLALTTGFFGAPVASCQPRYLPLFRGLLHPHLP